MINNPNQPIQFTWQAILWRLLLTLLLLLALAGPGLSLFRTVTSRPGTRALPALIQETEGGETGITGSGDLMTP
jgi:hypothetical protein